MPRGGAGNIGSLSRLFLIMSAYAPMALKQLSKNEPQVLSMPRAASRLTAGIINAMLTCSLNVTYRFRLQSMQCANHIIKLGMTTIASACSVALDLWLLELFLWTCHAVL